MRAIVIGVATAVALSVSAGGAAAQGFAEMPTVSGYIEGFGGASWYRFKEYDSGGTLLSADNSRSTTFGGAVRAAVEVMPDWRAQGDAWITRDNFSGSFCMPASSCSQQVWGVGGHFSHRAVGQPLLGALVSFGGSRDFYGTTQFVNVAGEVAKYLGPLTFYGQGGFVHSVAGDLNGQNARAWYIHGEFGYFATQNLYLSANVGFARYLLDDILVGGPPVLISDAHAGIWRWGARVEYKFDHAPVSLFVAYEGGRVKAPYTYGGTPYDDRIRDAVLVAGVRHFFQTTTIQGNQRAGAGLVDWNPIFGTAVVAY